MSTVTIDGKSYEFESLSEDAKHQFNNLQFVDRKLAELNAEAAVYQTARIGYAKALGAALPAEGSSGTH
jgi:hypothetical protein